MNTHVFKLTCGVECEVKPLTGREQRILTEQGSKKWGDKLNDMLRSVLVRVGTHTEFDDEFFREFLSADRKKILTEVRQFSQDFDPDFKFTWSYIDSSGQKAEHEVEVPIPDGFTTKPLLVLDGDQWEEASFAEYEDVPKKVRTVLPKSGMEVEWSLLNGKGEAIAMATKKSERSSHTAIELRTPVYFEKKESGNKVPIQLNLDNLVLKDIEHLRKEIKRIEGAVDTEILFEHPEAEMKPAGEKEVTFDVLQSEAFFFPSEAI